jgi:RNA polymerase sigma factor (sigma-70 family)
MHGDVDGPECVKIPAPSADNRVVDHGDADLETAYRALQPALLGHLRTRHAGQAEDIAGDIWTEVAASFPQFVGGDDALRSWVFTLARRRLIDTYRRAGRRPTERLIGDPGVAADRPEDETVARLSLEGTVARVRRLLPADQAEVLMLRVVSGLSVNEVATLLGKTPVNVRVLQHRALSRLGACLHPGEVA